MRRFFNVTLQLFPVYFLNWVISLYKYMSIYADDGNLRCVVMTRHERKIQFQRQKVLNAMCLATENVGMALEPYKTAVLLCCPRRRLPERALQVKMSAYPVKPVKTRGYLGFLVDDWVTWRPDVRKAPSKSRSLLSVLRHL